LESTQWEEDKFLSDFRSSKAAQFVLKMPPLGTLSMKTDVSITIREGANVLGNELVSVQSILKHNLNVRRIGAEFVPQPLSRQQQENRVDTLSGL
jgi:hypothetical protein